MSRRYVTLANGRACGLASYVHAWRTLLALDPATSVTGFDHFAAPAGQILRALRFGLHDRINRHDAAFGRGRKWSGDWQRAAGHLARAVNSPRLIVRPPQCPPEFRARLAHRLHLDD